MATITEPLEALIAASDPDEDVVIVVELTPAPARRSIAAQSRQEQIAERRTAFEQQLSPVERAIRDAGGEVLDHAWINGTMKARVPAHAVRALTGLGDVECVDVEHRLRRD